ncbi:MAG: CoA ester lyase [Sphingomonadaceae bacterium]|nr:CoA ester lyase [Sphingomonadaceae bacterium]
MTDAAFRPRRSCLYMPGANARALEKAKSLPADVLIFDLEDAVAPEAKDEARERVADAVREGGYGTREIVVRINAADSEWGSADLAAIAPARPDAILLPKATRAADIENVAADGLPLWAMIEMPLAILNIAEIAAADGLAAFVMGTNDLAKEMRAVTTPRREAFAFALSAAVTAARANDLIVIDGVFNAIDDKNGLIAEARQGRMLGFDGKSLIHPAQINTANSVFAPSEDDIAQARAIVAAFAAPENAGKGVLRVDGKMAERLHLAEAERCVAIAEAIAARA